MKELNKGSPKFFQFQIQTRKAAGIFFFFLMRTLKEDNLCNYVNNVIMTMDRLLK